jgi:uncharacterized protein YdaU (DUF1376 family)
MAGDTKVDVYIPIYVGDYLKDTRDLTAEEHGAYLVLLLEMWNREGYLPNDPVMLARLATVKRSRWPDVWATISRFFTITERGVTQKRLLRELEIAQRKKATAVLRAQAGGIAKARAASSRAQAALGGCPSPSPSPSSLREEIARARPGRGPVSVPRQVHSPSVEETNLMLRRRRQEEQRIAAEPVSLAELVALRTGAAR